jgi:deoxyribonuclease-4
MARTLARPEPRRRLSWPAGAPRVGIHLGVGGGLMKAARRARQIGATALQIFSDNPTAWRRRPQPAVHSPKFIAYLDRHDIRPVAIHASYLINLAGSAEPFASQSRAGLAHEMQRAPAYGARLVNTHIGSHRGGGREAGLGRIVDNVNAVLADSPADVTLVLENSSGGGDNLGSRIEDLAAILDRVAGTLAARLAFCLDTAHLWGAGYDISTSDGATALLDRFDELVGMDRLALVHLNDSRSELGSRTDRHEHIGGGRIGPAGLGAIMRDPRLAARTAFMMETPGVDEGYDAVNMRRAWLLFGGAETLPALPPKAFKLNRRSTRVGVRASSTRVGVRVGGAGS